MKFDFPFVEAPEGVDPEHWMDWRWQIRNALKTDADFSRYFEVKEELDSLFQKPPFKIQTTPYYARVAQNSSDVLKTIMPSLSELTTDGQQLFDPLGERQNQKVSRIIHRYQDRVLFLVTDMCAIYCRYCTRKHFTAKDHFLISQSEYQKALEYIRENDEISEVILSGGDPLTLSDTQLERIIRDLREIPHIEIIRIGSRIPAVNPMRLTKELGEMLRKYQPVFIMSHFNHPDELTQQAAHGIAQLVDHGIPVFNQMVLLNGVNNHPVIVHALSRRLLYLRVKPYYMFQCDPSEGTDHLRTAISESESIQKQLWGKMSGLAMPNLSLDPDGGGKVGLVPNFELSRTDSARKYQGYDGVIAEYQDPQHDSQVPSRVAHYSNGEV